MPDVDIAASLAVLERGEHVHDGMLKYPADLERFAAIIEATKPQIVVETGTHTGASARWFADLGVEVVTVDRRAADIGHPAVVQVVGDSADPAVAQHVAELVAGRRCMVTLDSYHSASHVRAEIAAYGPLVSSGCYLVVEDTIFGHASDELRSAHLGAIDGTPLEAIDSLQRSRRWKRDREIETMSPTTASPSGWWKRS